MARFLVHPVFVDRNHDYTGLSAALQELGAFAVTENIWLVNTELTLEALTQKLFSDRPPANRFLVMEIPPNTSWAAANLQGDMARWLAAGAPQPSTRRRTLRVFKKAD